MLSVGDTGHGMSVETQAHIFEPFFTTKDVGKGTGLGLSTVYGMVSQSGGFIWVDSEPYRGSTFRLYFPPAAVRPPAPAVRVVPRGQKEPPEKPAGPATGQTILVVEDEDAVRELVASTLAKGGYQVLRAASADEALDMTTDAGTIDLLLTDATMPGRAAFPRADPAGGQPDLARSGDVRVQRRRPDTSGLPRRSGCFASPSPRRSSSSESVKF